MSDSNRIKVAIKEESTVGSAAGAPYQQINVSGESLKSQKNTVEANTITDHRNLLGLTKTSQLPTGGFNCDLIHNNNTAYIEGVFAKAFSNTVSLTSVAVTISGTDTITADSGTPFSVVALGQWLKVMISTTAYIVQVAAINGSGNEIEVTGDALPNGSATLASVKGKLLRNGTVLKTYTVEKTMSDQSSEHFFTLRGCAPSTYAVSLKAEQVGTENVEFIGLYADAPTSSSASSATYTAPVVAESLAGLTDNVNRFYIGGTAVTADDIIINGLDINIATNARRDAGINGSTLGLGEFNVKGSLMAYFEGGLAAVQSYFAHTTSSISFVTKDSTGNYQVWTVHSMKFADLDNAAGAKNQAINMTLQFTGIYNDTYGCTLQYDVLAA